MFTELWSVARPSQRRTWWSWEVTGNIVPKDSKIVKELNKHLEIMLKKKCPEEAAQMTEMYVHKGIYVFDLCVNGTVQCEDDKNKVLAAVDSGFSPAGPEAVRPEQSDEVMVDEVDEEASEGRKPKALRSPLAPTLEEIEEHEMVGHAIHRSWCGHCMRSRGLMEQHQRAVPEDQGLPTLSINYFYFGNQDEGLPHLQAKDSHSGIIDTPTNRKSLTCWI